MAELKPCPFCGSKNVGDMNGWVQCFNCNAGGPNGDTKQQAIDAWNRRAK